LLFIAVMVYLYYNEVSFTPLKNDSACVGSIALVAAPILAAAWASTSGELIHRIIRRINLFAAPGKLFFYNYI